MVLFVGMALNTSLCGKRKERITEEIGESPSSKKQKVEDDRTLLELCLNDAWVQVKNYFSCKVKDKRFSNQLYETDEKGKMIEE